MEEDGPVAQGLHLGPQVGGAVGDIEMEGDRALRQEGHGVSGEEFVLRVGGGAPKDGGIGGAPDGVLRQAVEEGHGVFVGLQAEDLREVREGLVHDDDEVDGLRPVNLRRGAPLLRLQGDGAQGLLGVVLRGLHPAVAQADRKVEDKAVAPGGPQGGLDARPAQKVGLEKDQQIGGADQPRREGRLEPGPLPPRPLGNFPQQQEKEAQGQQAVELDLVRGVVVASRHIGGGAEGQQVPGEDGPAPEADDIAVGQPDAHKEGGHRPGGEPHPSGEEVEQPGGHVVPHQVQAGLEDRELGPDLIVVVHLLHQEKGQQRPQGEGPPPQPGGSLGGGGEGQGQGGAEGQSPGQGLPEGQSVPEEPGQHGQGQGGGGEEQVPPPGQGPGRLRRRL